MRRKKSAFRTNKSFCLNCRLINSLTVSILCLLSIAPASGFDGLDIFCLDVLPEGLASLFPTADEVGTEFLSVVVAVKGVDPTS